MQVDEDDLLCRGIFCPKIPEARGIPPAVKKSERRGDDEKEDAGEDFEGVKRRMKKFRGEG